MTSMYKIYADAGREDFCRALTDAGITPVFMPAVHGSRWGYAVPSEELVGAVNALLKAGIAVQKKQKMHTDQDTGKLKKE